MFSKEASLRGTVRKLFTRHPHHTKTDGVLSAAVLWWILLNYYRSQYSYTFCQIEPGKSYFPVSIWALAPSCSDEPSQGQVETLQRLGVESTTFRLDHKLSYKARREQAGGIKDLIL